MDAFEEVVLEVIRSVQHRVRLFELCIGAFGGFNGENIVFVAANDEKGARCNQRRDIAHLAPLHDPRYAIADTVMNGEDRVAKGAKISGHHGEFDAFVARG